MEEALLGSRSSLGGGENKWKEEEMEKHEALAAGDVCQPVTLSTTQSPPANTPNTSQGV